MPTVTVIIPTHCRPELLPAAVESAQAAGTDVEIIVVDDASTDQTAAVCGRLSGIRHIRLERNQGVAGARNVGLLESTGKYVTFLDDDDRRLPGSLDLQVKALEANPDAGFVCGAMIMADQNYQPTGEVSAPRHPGGDVFWELLELDFPVMPLSTLIRKECFLRVGLLNQHLRGIDDWDIFVRIAEHYPVLVMDTPVGLYRCPTPSSSQGSSDRAAQLRGAARQLRQLLKLPRAQAAPLTKRRTIHRRANNRLADTLLWNAARQLPGGEFGPAYANILGALRINPWRAIRPGAYKNLAGRLFLKRSDTQNM
ncbi:MAG TPA: glycosyltransferase family 2 protein [Pyrinomonadaceae bacterium]|nr:glycosyltransferase family 2 protein [Pyrinomonadaceae bacterium]